jgi:Flp pilus assembly protein TadB
VLDKSDNLCYNLTIKRKGDKNMENKNNNKKSGGIGFCGLLTIAFIILKLCGVIAWSWVWVLAPMWIPLALVVLILIITFLIARR